METLAGLRICDRTITFFFVTKEMVLNNGWGLSPPLELSMRLTKSEVKIINHFDMTIAADWVISPLYIYEFFHPTCYYKPETTDCTYRGSKFKMSQIRFLIGINFCILRLFFFS